MGKRGKRNLVVIDRCVRLLMVNDTGLTSDQLKGKLSEITTRYPSANAISNILTKVPGVEEVGTMRIPGGSLLPIWKVTNHESWRAWREKQA